MEFHLLLSFQDTFGIVCYVSGGFISSADRMERLMKKSIQSLWIPTSCTLNEVDCRVRDSSEGDQVSYWWSDITSRSQQEPNPYSRGVIVSSLAPCGIPYYNCRIQPLAMSSASLVRHWIVYGKSEALLLFSAKRAAWESVRSANFLGCSGGSLK
ncbi:hypothetical protein NPIL_509541 [Nephila pilipes]|uniref:Uncharacterized protein n=1 Tax=Nephila pilipes TaxID=299642 RepID=A0A8X6N5L9_NEPPI|nr:hypothetical protein NPIL_509541 [Nephila pilipes]